MSRPWNAPHLFECHAADGTTVSWVSVSKGLKKVDQVISTK